MSGNARMNRLILAAARRGEHATGGVARLSGEDDRAQRREKLGEALAAAELAERAGDEILAGMASEQIDQVLGEARAAATERGRDPETGQFVSFDGGIHGRRPIAPGSGAREETSNELFRRMVDRSRFERKERETERPLTGNPFAELLGNLS